MTHHLSYLEQMIVNGHDTGDALDLALAAESLACTTCKETREVLPDGSGGWIIGHAHEPHCPQHEDNHEATEVDFDQWPGDGA